MGPSGGVVNDLTLASPGDDEQAPERKERAAVGAAWIRARRQLRVARLEAAAVGLVERREQRHEPASLHPLLHGIDALQNLQILDLPDVERGRPRGQEIEVEARLRHRIRPEQRLELFAPWSVADRVRDQRVRRRAEVPWELNGEDAARLEPRQQRGKDAIVVAEPVERGIRVDDVGRAWRPPRRQISPLPGDRRSCDGGLGEHLRRLVDSRDARVRPARPEELRDVASPGAKIVDLYRIFDVDAVQQIDGRSQPVPGELEVLRRIPGCHSWTSLRARARCAAPSRGAPDASRRRPALAAASPSSPARRSPRRRSGTGGCESPRARSRASRPRSRTAPGPWPGPDRGPAAPEPPSIYIAPRPPRPG